ncbi:MAG TPA: hypothetical protein DHW42_05865 [Candidatus Marinimicrobia bacterium]|nr:hypothetical protein [Candidatus Neomarinimicrobiota bacterium]
MPSIKPVILSPNQIDKGDKTFDIFIGRRENNRTDFSLPLNRLVLVQFAGDKYRIIYGFDTIQNLKQPDVSIAAYSVCEDIDITELFIILIEVRLSDGGFSPVEVGRLLVLAEDQHISENRIAGRLLPALKITPNSKFIKQYRQITGLEEPVREYLILKKAPLKTWILLANISPADLKIVKNLLALRPTLSVLEELVVHLTEISKRDHSDFKTISSELNLDQYWLADYPEVRNSLSAIRTAVFLRRFPQLGAHKAMIDQGIKRLGIPPNMQIDYDQTFEKKEINLFCRLRNSRDIESLCDYLKDARIEKIRRLLDRL